MQSLLRKLQIADFEFLLAIIRGRTNLTSDKELRAALDDLSRASASYEQCDIFCRLLEREIRYLGSSEIAYLIRKVTKRSTGPGVSFSEIAGNVFRKQKLARPTTICTDEELLEFLVKGHTTVRMRKLPIDQQKALLESVGMAAGDIGSFLKSNATRFGIPALIQFAGVEVTQRIVTNAVIGTVSQYVGRQTAKSLIVHLAARFPVWAEWLGPIAWGISGLWTAYDLQGPASRKTVPIMLYLGLCMLRDGGLEAADA